MASSSSSTIGGCDGYDVFLSFRGTDTRNDFTSNLYSALCQAQVKAFIDENLDKGEEITPTLERVIEGAKISIIVFSPDYASSRFCLDELVKIMECKESKGQIVFPIFYKVHPAPSTYEESFAKHKTIKQEMKVESWTSFFWNTLNLASNLKAFEEETIKHKMKVESWKSAFHKALELAGWPIDDNSVQAKIIGEVTRKVLEKLNSSQSRGEEVMSTSMIGQTAEDSFKNIWECLMNNDSSRIGIYGMGGVGKTTIATRINNQLLGVANSFTHIYWITVSKDSSIYKLQSGIAEKIKLDLSKEDDEKRRAAMIRKTLSNKKFLLILDDVWEAYELTKDVGIPFLFGGGKLLLTTRDLRVCKGMQCQSFQVEPLSRREAWDLFIEESQCEIDDSPEWREVAESIVKKCAGLPLAIIVIARRMRGIEEISEWRNTLRELEKPCEGENQEMEEKVFKPLKVSYDHLPKDVYRHCFMYYSLFPEDYEIRRNDLIDYWIAEGLIDGLDSKQEEIDKGNHIIDILIAASLLEYARRTHNRIKMHDVIRDMAHFHMKAGLQFQRPLKEVKWSLNFGCVEVMNYEMLRLPNSIPNCSKLGTLILVGHRFETDLPERFFAKMQKLTVLEMNRIIFPPESITSLKNLRMLAILHCEVYWNRIPELKNLRHLDILNTTIREIPEGLERLVNLRVLRLSFNFFLDGSFPSAVLEKLSHLQSLRLDGTKIEVELDALNGLKKLEMLRLSFNDMHKLNSYVKSGHWQRLVEYQINYAVNGRGILQSSCKKSMSLDVEGVRDLRQWTRKSDISFPDDVQFLQLNDWDSPMLDVLRSQTFVDLQMIEFKRYRGRYLFTPALAQQLLHNIKELKFISCYGLEEIIATEEECVDQSNYNNYPTIVVPKLERLTLLDTFELRSIYRGRMVCRKLEYIRMDKCKKLERFPFRMEEERNKQNLTIRLEGYYLDYEWLDSLHWDNSNAKSMYQIHRSTLSSR